MYPVTQDFESLIFDVPRTVHGRVTFDITPSGLEQETPNVTLSNAEFALSAASTQISDNVRQATYQFCTWEQDRTILDGRFTFASDSVSGRGEMGWVTNDIIASTGLFGLYPATNLYPGTTLYPSTGVSESIILTYTNTYSSAGFTITFDPITGEYSTRFTIYAYDAFDNIVFTHVVTNNTLVQYILITPINNFRKLEVVLFDWSVPNRRARVIEIDAGVVLTYNDNEIIRFNSTEEMDPLTSTLVIPEFTFTINNSDGTFDILNPSGIYSSLQTRQRIYAELGLEIDATRTEWVPIGTYYLTEWKSDSGALTATFTGRNKLDLLNLENYEQLTAQNNYSVYDLIEDILQAAKISGYSIDTSLQTVYTNGMTQKTSCRQALQMAAMAGRSNIFIGRDDILYVRVYDATPSLVKGITFDEMFEEPQIEVGRPVYSVEVLYFTDLNDPTGGYAFAVAANAKGENISLTNNTFINSTAHAQSVAEWIYAVRNNSKLFTVDYRGNPSLELNDFLETENRYDQTQTITLTKIDMTYEGYLSSQVKGRS